MNIIKFNKVYYNKKNNLVTDEKMPTINEELIVELVGQFNDEESVSPQTLKVFELEFQLD